MNKNTLIPLNNQALKFAFDVGKRSLDFYGEIPVINGFQPLKGQIRNHPKDIKELLLDFKNKALQVGFSNALIVCEPTGIYHRQLFRVSDQLGLESSLVSGEATHKGKIFAKNTLNKTDEFDPYVIYKVSQIAPEIKRRSCTDDYDALREWGRLECTAKYRLKRIRTELKEHVHRIFPTFQMGPDFLNQKNGKAISKAFGFDPRNILAKGESAFKERYAKHSERAQKQTYSRIWEAAQEMKESMLTASISKVYTTRIAQLYKDMEEEEARAKFAMDQMIEITKKLKDEGDPIPCEHKELFTEEWIARILAECGPLADFDSYRQLEKYAGMNLCENRSGIKVGQVSMDKKGSSKLRRMFMDLAFKLTPERCCYGKIHKEKREKGMNGKKSMTAIARKLLKAFWGMAKNKEIFNPKRLHLSQSELKTQEALQMVG